MDGNKEFKLAIIDSDDSFCSRWFEYCNRHNIPHVKVDMFDSAFLYDLKQSQANAFLFHLPLHDLKTQLYAEHIARAVALMGIKVFPCDTNYWHFDDKIAQKYLFESLKIPACRTWVFYDHKQALEWAAAATYPKIFKLRRGAGSSNVSMITSSKQACKIIDKMFAGGLKSTPTLLQDYKTKLYKHKQRRDWLEVFKRLPSTMANIAFMQDWIPREKGYAYFQDFLPDNSHDTRVTVIGRRAFAFRRFTRPGDFRASGSGHLDWNPELIDKRCIELAFDVASKTGAQCLALDIVYDSDRRPIVLEVCYAFMPTAVYECPGYWDQALSFHEGHVWPQDAIITDIIQSIHDDGNESASH